MDILKYLLRSCEKIPSQNIDSGKEASLYVAQVIAQLIREKEQQGEYAILGLATRSTPIQGYNELIRMHREDGLSFKNVVTFNLDEYYPMKRNDDQRYWTFMHEHLFKHIDIDPNNIHIPDREIPTEQVKENQPQTKKQ